MNGQGHGLSSGSWSSRARFVTQREQALRPRTIRWHGPRATSDYMAGREQYGNFTHRQAATARDTMLQNLMRMNTLSRARRRYGERSGQRSY